MAKDGAGGRAPLQRGLDALAKAISRKRITRGAVPRRGAARRTTDAQPVGWSEWPMPSRALISDPPGEGLVTRCEWEIATRGRPPVWYPPAPRPAEKQSRVTVKNAKSVRHPRGNDGGSSTAGAESGPAAARGPLPLDAYQERLPPEVVVEARVLGPVEVVGWRVLPDRQVVTELCCYLALHGDRPVPGDALRSALWSESREASAKSMRTYVSLLRRSLGAGLFPEAEKGAGYQLDPAVTSDWQRLCDQVADADRCARQGDADLSTLLLRRALQLVRGTPFAGASGGSYAWAWSELVVAEMERTIADVGERVAVAALGSEHLDLAEWGLRRALLGVPFAEGLWDRRVEVAKRQGPFALNRVRRDRRAVLGEDPDADTK